MPLIKRQKVAFWGASRTLDALVKYGALDLSNAHIIVDSYLHGKLNCMENMILKSLHT